MHKIGHDIYRALTKPRGRKDHSVDKIDKHRLYSPSQVAHILSCSYNTALSRMRTSMRGYQDHAVRSGKRIKSLPRVPGWAILEYMQRMEK
jgi:hypothetical protein